MLKILWYILCIILLLFDNTQNRNMNCNPPLSVRPYVRSDTSQLNGKEKSYTKVDFTRAVLKGADEVEVSNSYDAITKDNVLGGIFFNSMQYRNEIRHFLGSAQYTTDQKLIVVCLMQNLPLKEYLKICNYCAELLRNNKIEEEVLMWTIAPNFGKRQIITRSYQDPEVIATLKDIRSIQGLSRTTKRVINQILTGEETKFL